MSFMLIILLVQALPVATASASTTVQPDARVSALVSKAQTNGTMRVIVGLNIQTAPEGALGSPSAVTDQRQAIARAQGDFLQRLRNYKVRTTAQFAFIPFLGMEVDATALAALSNDPAVLSIEEDRLHEPTLDDSIPLIGGSATGTFGSTNRTGAGQTVAVLDTGVMKTHSFLANKVVSEACYSTTDAAQGSTAFCTPDSTAAGSGVNCPDSIDGCDHGTHVAGIVAGKGSTFNGVAKDATLIAIQVFSRFEGSNCGGGVCALSYTSDQIKALERVYALRSTYKIASVNMSLGGGGPFNSNCDANNASSKAAMDNLLSVGIATIVASGNNGFSNGVSSPACISTAVTVGSTTKSDQVSSFSNSGIPIDLLAPGSDIWASVASSTTAFGFKSGTSMATPHVAGAWAVMKQQNPSASVSQIQQTLQNTGVSITDADNGIARKRISLTAAVNALPTGPNPVPTISTLSPSVIANGSTAFTLTVNGSNFVEGAKVRWNGSNRTTTFVNATQLTAAITAADIATAGSFPISVVNPSPGGGASANKTFKVDPSCNYYEPNNSLAEARDLPLDKTQLHNFCTQNDQDWIKFTAKANYRYKIATSDLSTVAPVNTVLSLSDAAGKVLVPESHDASTTPTSSMEFVPPAAGTYYLKLRNRSGGFSPNSTYHIRLTAGILPIINSISPSSREAGHPEFTLVVRGQGFAKGSEIRWKGVTHPTIFVNGGELRTTITRADIGFAGTYPILVYSPPPLGGGKSNIVNFTVTPMQTAPVPTVTSLSKTSVEAGSAGFELAVRGSNFVPRSAIRWNNQGRTTKWVNSTELRITLTDADLATVGTKTVSVFTSTPGGGVSNSLNFTITTPVTPCNRDEPNNTNAQAKTLPFDTVRVYAFCASGDLDIVKLNANANSEYIIDVLTPGSSVDAVITVYDANGTWIGEVDSGGSGVIESARFTTDASGAGTYYIEFSDWWNRFGTGAENQYSVRIKNVTGTGSINAPDAGTGEHETRVESLTNDTK
jgi:subtilisin